MLTSSHPVKTRLEVWLPDAVEGSSGRCGRLSGLRVAKV